MKLVIVGNCQITYIGERLRQGLQQNSEIYIPKPIHLISDEDIIELHQKVTECDCLAIQPIGDSYRGTVGLGTNFLKNILRNDAQSIVIPNLYFGGLFPTFGYLSDKNNNRILARDKLWEGQKPPFSDYHDYLMLISANKGFSSSEFINLVNSSLPIKFIGKLFDKSYDELEKRDRVCDVKATDLLSSADFSPSNFSSFNHPSNALMDRVAIAVLELAGTPRAVFKDNTVEEFAHPKLPVYPFLFESAHEFVIEETIKKYDFYSNFYQSQGFKERIAGVKLSNEYQLAQEIIEAANV
ncbi:WcbI family polysaccharide biosynthesis putative acetyltransferase [Paraglaciecola sp. 25GB23A]|uniref:WcbI family polysaccharide biosynthesis putative acetyltransferase n=1 Tax=Paraglaciecola sp. 25GB23A TaxID=3156068 RepID=UPI0032AEC1E2